MKLKKNITQSRLNQSIRKDKNSCKYYEKDCLIPTFQYKSLEFCQDFKKLIELVAEHKLTEIFELLEPKGWKDEEIIDLIGKLTFKIPSDKALQTTDFKQQNKEVLL